MVLVVLVLVLVVLNKHLMLCGSIWSAVADEPDRRLQEVNVFIDLKTLNNGILDIVVNITIIIDIIIDIIKPFLIHFLFLIPFLFLIHFLFLILQDSLQGSCCS